MTLANSFRGASQQANVIFGSNSATLANGEQLQSGLISTDTVDKLTFIGRADVPGLDLVIESYDYSGQTPTVETLTYTSSNVYVTHIPITGRIMRVSWKNNTGFDVNEVSMTLRQSTGSSGELTYTPTPTIPIPTGGAVSELGDFFFEVSKGNVDGHSVVFVVGQNTDVDAALPEYVWPEGGTVAWLDPLTPEFLNIVSDSILDSFGNTGATFVQVSGLGLGFVEQTEVVQMNGTTPVSTAFQYIRVNQMIVADTGGGIIGANAGEITATAAVSATIQHLIEPAEGLSRCGFYTIPAGKTFYATYVEFEAVESGFFSSSLVEMGSFIKPNQLSTLSSQKGFSKYLDTGSDNTYVFQPKVLFPVPETSDFYILANSDSNNIICGTIILGVLVDN